MAEVETSTIGFPWRNTDPRFSVNKRANIVIVRKEGLGYTDACLGYVDTKDTWTVKTYFQNYERFSADDEWNEDFYWTWVPWEASIVKDEFKKKDDICQNLETKVVIL